MRAKTPSWKMTLRVTIGFLFFGFVIYYCGNFIMESRNKKLNRGLSGCFLDLIGGNIVKKISSNPAYNERLFLQIRKQQLFSSMEIPYIKTPAIKHISHEDYKLFFEMDFIEGLSFDEFCINADDKSLESFYNNLYSYIHSLKSDDYYSENEIKEILQAKIQSLEKNTQYVDVLSMLSLKVQKCNGGLLKSFCHGDLSCLNIIIKGDEIYFIDFLDSFVDTPLIDLIKLKQDLKHYWFLSSVEPDVDVLKIKKNCDRLWMKFENDFKFLLDSPYAEILEILNFLRIEPYLNNQKQKDFLKCIIELL